MESRSLCFVMRKNGGERFVREVLKEEFGLTKRQISRLKFRPGGILLNGKPCRTNFIVRPGDSVTICLDDPRTENAEKAETDPRDSGIEMTRERLKAGPLCVLYEDEDILIVDKPAGIVVHQGRGHYGDTLSDRVREYLLREPGCKIHSVGRLDKDTSGVMVFAKNAFGAQRLEEERIRGELRKTYLAAAAGCVGEEGKSFSLDLPIAKDETEKNRMKTSEDGLAAETEVSVLCAGPLYSVLLVRIETGRTHQIRVHLASAGHPLLGDPIYGTGECQIGGIRLERAALHCLSVGLIQPFTGRLIAVAAPVPEDMAACFPEAVRKRLERDFRPAG